LSLRSAQQQSSSTLQHTSIAAKFHCIATTMPISTATSTPRSHLQTEITKLYLIVAQSDHYFGIELSALREVTPLQEVKITAVPNIRPLVKGVFNLRGEILAVTDFGEIIGIAPTLDYHDASRIVVLEIAPTTDRRDELIRFGLAVNQVMGVVSLQVDRIASAAEVGSKLTPILQGLYPWEGRLLMLLDGPAIAALLAESASP
jgi:purine-binding chemotaxis protein CheW